MSDRIVIGHPHPFNAAPPATTKDDLGRPGTTWDNLGQPGTTRDDLGRPRKTWDGLGQHGTTWADLGRPGTTWEDLGPAGTTWDDRLLDVKLRFRHQRDARSFRFVKSASFYGIEHLS